MHYQPNIAVDRDGRAVAVLIFRFASSQISSRLKRDASSTRPLSPPLTEAVVVLNRAGGDASRRHLAREAFDIA
jgi:hypothetical protein